MKLLLILLIALFSNVILYSQEGEYVENELTIQIQNAVSRTIVFEMIPIGPNWAKTYSGCNISAYNDPTTYTSSLYAGYDGYVTCGLMALNIVFMMKATIRLLVVVPNQLLA